MRSAIEQVITAASRKLARGMVAQDWGRCCYCTKEFAPNQESVLDFNPETLRALPACVPCFAVSHPRMTTRDRLRAMVTVQRLTAGGASS